MGGVSLAFPEATMVVPRRDVLFYLDRQSDKLMGREKGKQKKKQHPGVIHPEIGHRL